MSKATISKTIEAINSSCKSLGKPFNNYSCKTVSWDDVQRGTVDGSLSCWGGNITDTRLYEKSGQQLYVVRSDNWNEKLGKVKSDQIAVVVGNHIPGETSLKPITLQNFLNNISEYGKYAKIPESTNFIGSKDISAAEDISIRFQTTFLPIPSEAVNGSVEFCTEAYNYNTNNDNNPANIVVLCTTQGIAIQQDGKGAKKLFHHAVDPENTVHEYWLEAERSKHKVGGAQIETLEEKLEAANRGKATASVIGTIAMGTRFNALMTIQIPLKLQKLQKPKKYKNKTINMSLDQDEGEDEDDDNDNEYNGLMALNCNYDHLKKRKRNSAPRSSSSPIGTANAARVSRGSEVGIWKGLTVQKPERDPSQFITATIVFYYTVAGGVPSEADVKSAIEDMESLYASCGWSGNLADEGANFMKTELTVSSLNKITTKIATQPYQPPVGIVNSSDVFPS